MTTGLAPAAAAGHRRRPRLLAVLLAALLLLFSALTITQSAAAHKITLGSFNTGAGLILTLWVIAAVGLVVAWHQPGNPIGWLLLAAPTSLAVTFASDGYDAAYRAGQHTLPVLGPAALTFAQLFFFPFTAFPLIIWLFPDGRLPPGRWKWGFWISLALTVPGFLSVLGATIAAEAGHHVHVLSDGQLAQVENPSSPVVGGLTQLFLFGLVGGWLGALAWQIASWRRSSGERRQQLKWLMSGAAVCGVFAIASFGSSASLWEILIVGIIALPVSIGIGILKYRLYDIDRIISRTLAYALITGLLVGVYAGLVLLATQVLRFSSPVAVAVSTLAAAALFNPVRRRVQHAVDRRFNRARYNADAAVEAFAARLAGAVALGEVRSDLLAVVVGALEPAHLSVWLADGER
jgi:hypothetical protein